MPDKLTDSEIVKAFEEYYKGIDKGYSTYLEQGGKSDEYEEKHLYMVRGVLDLINRLQAENERLKTQLYLEKYTDVAKRTIKAEAYKECIEKVKEEINEALINNYKVRSERAQSIPIYTKDEFWNYCAGKIDCLRGLDDYLDNLLKELVGDKNESTN